MKIVLFAFVFLITIQGFTKESNSNLNCSTPNKEKVFTIFFKDKENKSDKVVFEKAAPFLSFDKKRQISSADKIRTLRNTSGGFTKWLDHDGKKFKIYIQNAKKLNSVNDYVVISQNNKYRITYPITCSWE